MVKITWTMSHNWLAFHAVTVGAYLVHISAATVLLRNRRLLVSQNQSFWHYEVLLIEP